ncbi:MAG: hypothetical protein HYY89_02245 [candidate division NC10 bacterium]|nr:hypothetical protein [candidate division NC10 bacterium]
MRGLAAFREEVAAFRREVRALRTALAGPRTSLLEALRRRGILLGRAGAPEGLLFPSTLSQTRQSRLYEHLKRYSFRLFLRDLIAHQDALRPEALTRFCSAETAARYFRFLRSCGIIRRGRGGTLRLHQEGVFSFGATLEWLVAQVLTREFGAPALWGCRLLDLGEGGDYDVLSLVEGSLLYVEVKSSPPKHIEEAEVAAFLDRLSELMPNVAIFLVDTELRMKDKLVGLFEAALARREGRGRGRPARPPAVTRLLNETFVLEGSVFLTNTRPSLVQALGTCLRAHFGRR